MVAHLSGGACLWTALSSGWLCASRCSWESSHGNCSFALSCSSGSWALRCRFNSELGAWMSTSHLSSPTWCGTSSSPFLALTPAASSWEAGTEALVSGSSSEQDGSVWTLTLSWCQFAPNLTVKSLASPFCPQTCPHFSSLSSREWLYFLVFHTQICLVQALWSISTPWNCSMFPSVPRSPLRSEFLSFYSPPECLLEFWL